ncbi:MAG: MFS transporter [Chloroflexota bacterium]
MSTVVKGSPYRYRWAALGFALLCQCSSNIIYQVIPPLAPLFQQDLGLTKAEVGLVSSAASVGVWSIVLMGGLITDRFGVRKVMAFCLIATGCIMSSMLMANSLFFLLAVMFLSGLARGPVFPSSTKAVAEWFPARERATAMGINRLGLPIAGISAASILPAFGLAVGWRTAAAVPGLLVLISGIAVALYYRDAPVPVLGKASPVNVRRAMRELLHNRMLLTLSAVGFFFLFTQFALVTYLVLYFKEVALLAVIPDEATRIVAAGGYLATCHVGGAFGRIFWGLVSDRLLNGYRAIVLAMIGGISASLLALLGIASSGWPIWLLTAIAFGCGATALGWNGVFGTLVTDTVGRKYAATGVGLSMTMTDIATISAPPLFGFLVDMNAGYSVAYLVISLAAATGCLIALNLHRQEKRLRTSS